MSETNNSRRSLTSRRVSVRKIAGNDPFKKPWFRDLAHPGQLTWSARIVLGLNGMGICEPEEVAESLGITEQQDILQLTKFIERLRASKNRVIIDILKDVLPAKCAVDLPGDHRVCCVYCGKYASFVPCVNCTPEDSEDSREVDTPLLPCTEPTSYLPGTAAKLAVMAERVERGEVPFHKDDAGDYKSLERSKEW